jgi:outer membrane protein
MSVPLINEPTLGAGVQSAEAARVQAEGRQELLALQVQQQATEAWLNLQESLSRLTAAQAALQSNEENYRLASERYNVGVGNSLEVSDAQRLLVQARSQEVQARFDVQLAIARLYRQAGSLTLETFLPVK